MTAVMALLALGDTGLRAGFLANRPALMGDEPQRDPIFRTDVPLDRDRWTGIVIHHLGQPAGDAESIRQMHLDWGYQSLGYHFLIGNGRGMGDGDVFVGERWVAQQPGVHTTGERSDYHNLHSIGICLVGNGDRRPFTDRQIAALASLVRRLQRELDIPADRVSLHRQVAPGVSSPGRYFPAAKVREQMLLSAR